MLVLLTLLWVSVAAPYNTRRPARWWAELLGLEEGDGNGARLLRSTMQELELRKFIRINREDRSEAPEVFLLNESANGHEYEVPAVASTRQDSPEAHGYFRVPDAFWVEGLCTRLSGPGLAMYLIALSASRSEGSFWFSASLFKERYGLSESTKKKGLRELVELGVLLEDTRSIDSAGDTMGRRYTRKVYLLADQWRSQNREVTLIDPAPAASNGATGPTGTQ